MGWGKNKGFRLAHQKSAVFLVEKIQQVVFLDEEIAVSVTPMFRIRIGFGTPVS
jgi:hypothetical protein